MQEKIPGEPLSGEYKYHFTRNTHGPARTCSMRHARAGADPSRTVRQHQSKTPSESTSCFIPPDDAVVSLQDVLQIISFNIYYTQLNGKIKMTMQEIMKKCFFFVLAFCLAGSLFFCANLQLAGQGNARSMPGWRMWSTDHARLDNTSWQQKRRHKAA